MPESINSSSALVYRSHDYPESFGNRVPKVVRMLHTVRMALPFLIRAVELSIPFQAESGRKYYAWVNSHGAVSAVIGTGEYGMLGLKPGEFEVVEWWELSNV